MKRTKLYLMKARSIAEIFMDLFNNITETKDVSRYDPPYKRYVDINDPVIGAIEKYKSHSCIRKYNCQGRIKLSLI